MGERKGVYRVQCGKLRVSAHKEDLGIEGRKILKSVLRNGFGLGSDSCDVVWGHCRAVVNAVINLRLPLNTGIALTTWRNF
jgi:hypothetical protein